MSRAARVSVLLLLSALATGCGRLPANRYYVVQVQPPVEAERGDGLAIGVAAFHVDPPYDQDRIVYRLGASSPQVAFYPYDRWAAPLSRMLPAAVAAGLQGLKGVVTVEPIVPGRDHDARIHGRLVTLEEVDVADGPRVRLEITLELLARDGEGVWSVTLQGQEAVAATEVEEIVDAMNRLLAAELGRVRPGLEEAIATLRTGRATD